MNFLENPISSLISLMGSDGFWEALNSFAGAALGASFYVLLKTQPYLVNRSFDPKYNAAYISRFITGFIAGVILASAIAPNLNLQSATATALSKGVLSILGGYAAEAVEQILHRLVEVLLALVRGDGIAQVQAKAIAEQAEKRAMLQGLLPDLEAVRSDEAKFKESLQKIHAALKWARLAPSTEHLTRRKFSQQQDCPNG